MIKKKIRVAVIFGGRSAEHEVSIVSAQSVVAALDKKKYEVIQIGINKQGKWFTGDKVASLLKSGAGIPSAQAQTLPADPTVQSLISLSPISRKSLSKKIDVIIPLLHGTFGEDGTVQGLLELASVPYVGAGVLGSAVGMDKIAQKQIYQAQNIPTPKFDYFTKSDYTSNERHILRRLNKLGLPVFVKPANLGSSVGISKVKQGSQLRRAINLALKYDRRIIIEKAVRRALEIEVAVLGNDKPIASVPGQIVPSNEFYDYNAKYVDGMSKPVIPALIPSAVSKRVQELAVEAFKALDLAGMARVDFLVQAGTRQVYLNEVNTIPGFTSISMYPKLWQASGLSYPRLLDKLVQLALERHQQRAAFITSYRPEKKWYS